MDMTHDGGREASLLLEPDQIPKGLPLVVRGSGFSSCPVRFAVEGQNMPLARVLQGWPDRGGVRPDHEGEFVAEVVVRGVEPGEYRLDAASVDHKASAPFTLLEPFPQAAKPDGEDDQPLDRMIQHFARRFGHLGYIPEGTRGVQIDSVRALRALRDFGGQPRRPDRPGPPGPGVRNWTPVGPVVVPKGQTAGLREQAVSGRVAAIALHPTAPGTVLLGTASGGLWKSTNHGATWSPKTDNRRSPAISAIAFDPRDANRVIAGTGEYNQVRALTYYGNGLLRSTDGGDTWTEIALATFTRDEVTRILFDPSDTTSQRLFLAASSGVYSSTDGGTNWTLSRAGPASDLVLLYDPAGAGTLTVIAGFEGSGLWRRTRTGTTWGTWTQITSAAFPASVGRIALGQAPSNARTIYVAFGTPFDHPLAGMAKTTDGGASWTTLTGPATSQSWYNLVLAVHPTDPQRVFYGEVGLWRSTDGGANWTNVTDGEISPPPSDRAIGLHADQHVVVFDPSNPDVVWSGNDGGVFRSRDGGNSWTHRNRDLALLQYMHLSHHPQLDAVLLAGSQDNGTHRHLGSPVWEHSAYGDGGFTAIDPTQPTRMYHGYVRWWMYRSDSAGTRPSWVSKSSGLPAVDAQWEFYPPFALDPVNPSVCYFAGARLWRSDNRADSWSRIGGTLSGTATALAVNPADTDQIYVGTSTGRIYRIERTGATWSGAHVTTTDLTAAPLPAGVTISDLAIDPGGTVWATVGSVLFVESSGEFTNDHVFRLPVGTGTWENRSSGLAQANPVNTIVIDPSEPRRLFCGADVGVFRTNDAGATWAPWDEGLPNVPVHHLAISPGRLLRAATFGRSVWERPIDDDTPRPVDLYVRDSPLDIGRVQPSPSGVPHPFTPTQRVFWWQSPDVKVDAPEPAYQTPALLDDYVAVEGELVHRSARRGRVNRFYLQVHNRGYASATDVRVRAFFANASLGLPALPADFWTAGRPFSGMPSATAWTPIGPTRTIPVLEPAEPGLVAWEWGVPSDAADHSCLLVVTTCAENPLDGGGILDVGQLVTTRKQVALRNLHVANPVPGAAGEAPIVVEMHEPRRGRRSQDLVLDWETLPEATRVYLALENTADRGHELRFDEGARRHEAKIGGSEDGVFPDELPGHCGSTIPLDLSAVARMVRKGQPNERSDRLALLGVRIPKGKPLRIAVNVILPGFPEQTAPRFTLFARQGRRILGGSTFELRPPAE